MIYEEERSKMHMQIISTHKNNGTHIEKKVNISDQIGFLSPYLKYF